VLWWHDRAMVARGGGVVFMPGRAENSKFCGLCLGVCLDLCFGEHGDEYQAKEKLALIPKLMYLPRVNAKTQIKSESLKPRENTIKKKPMKVGR